MDSPPGDLQLHIGSAAVGVHVRPLGPHSARLRLARPLPLRVGDRVLLRAPGRHSIVAGATVLDLRPPPLNRRGAARLRDAELAGLAGAPLSAVAESVLRRDRFADERRFHADGLPVVGVDLAGWRADPRTWDHLVHKVAGVVDTWCAEHALQVRGMPVSLLAKELALPAPALADRLVRAAGLAVVDGHVRGAAARLPAAIERALAALTRDLADAPFAAPPAGRLAELGLGAKELAAAEAAGRLLRLAGGVVLLPGADRRAAAVLARLPQPFTVSQARQVLGSTRRVTLPLLQHLDDTGTTHRNADDTRTLS